MADYKSTLLKVAILILRMPKMKALGPDVYDKRPSGEVGRRPILLSGSPAPYCRSK